MDLAAIAAAVDALALESPALSPERPPALVEIVRFEAAAPPPGAPPLLPHPEGGSAVSLRIETRGPLAARAFRAERGAVEVGEGDALFYVPRAPGRSRVEAHFLSARGFRTSASIEVEPPR